MRGTPPINVRNFRAVSLFSMCALAGALCLAGTSGSSSSSGLQRHTARIPFEDVFERAAFERAAPSTRDLLHLPTTWAVATAGLRGPLVATVDTGVAPTAALAGRVEPGQSFAGGDATQDENGHGTEVAGIIAGDGGVCPTCRILPLRVTPGSSGTASSEHIAAAVDAAVAGGAAVINLSMVANMPTELERDAIGRAVAAGIVVVAAAGNGSSSTPSFPASYLGVLSVGAAGEDGKIAEFSNRGAWVSVIAPACGLTFQTTGASTLFCGTSAATPFVAGVAAMLRAAAPAASAQDVIAAIERTAQPVDGVANGIVDAGAALASITGQAEPSPNVPEVSLEQPAPTTGAVGVGSRAAGFYLVGRANVSRAIRLLARSVGDAGRAIGVSSRSLAGRR